MLPRCIHLNLANDPIRWQATSQNVEYRYSNARSPPSHPVSLESKTLKKNLQVQL